MSLMESPFPNAPSRQTYATTSPPPSASAFSEHRTPARISYTFPLASLQQTPPASIADCLLPIADCPYSRRGALQNMYYTHFSTCITSAHCQPYATTTPPSSSGAIANTQYPIPTPR